MRHIRGTFTSRDEHNLTFFLSFFNFSWPVSDEYIRLSGLPASCIEVRLAFLTMSRKQNRRKPQGHIKSDGQTVREPASQSVPLGVEPCYKKKKNLIVDNSAQNAISMHNWY